MPTIPRDPEATHAQREVAESFGVDAARYDRTRPRYPAALVEWIVGHSPGPALLDVGAGTGITSRAFRDAGCRVLGVEPDARMADFARATGIDVEVSTFEDWDPAGRTFDAVAAGQAWHWVDPVAGAAAAARVLRPGGLLALFWNAVAPRAAAVGAFADVMRRVLPADLAARATVDTLGAYTRMTAMAADGVRSAGGFAEPSEQRFDGHRSYTRDEWLDQLPTLGLYTRLPPDTLDALLTGVGEAIDALGGTLEVDVTTVLLTAVRR